MKRTTIIYGFGPDAPVIANARGAKQSDSAYKFTDFDACHVLRVAAVSGRGHKKYGPQNYLGIPTDEHIDHALAHIYAFQAGDEQEDHLAHAICRLYFAMATDELPADDPALRCGHCGKVMDTMHALVTHDCPDLKAKIERDDYVCPNRHDQCPPVCRVLPDEPCPLDPFDERRK